MVNHSMNLSYCILGPPSTYCCYSMHLQTRWGRGASIQYSRSPAPLVANRIRDTRTASYVIVSCLERRLKYGVFRGGLVLLHLII